MFANHFRLALQNATNMLMDCMELLWQRNGYVNLADLSNHCGGSAHHVMGNFSRSIPGNQGGGAVRDLYLEVRWVGNEVDAYRLRAELRDLVEEALREDGRT